MADSSTPKPPQAPVLPGSTSEEAIDLVGVGECCEVIEGEKAVEELETAEKEQDERETVTTQDSNPLESLEESDVGIREEKDDDDDKAEKEAVVELAGSDREGVSDSDSATHPEAAAAQENQEEEQDVTSLCSPPPSASDSVAASTSLSAALPSSSISTPTPLLEVDTSAEELECPPGLDPPMSVTLLKPTTTPCEDGPLPLETVLPSQSTPASPPFSSSSHQDSYESDPTPQANLEQVPAEYEDAQQEEVGLFYGHAPEQPQYPHDPFHHHHHQVQAQRPFEPLPPSQLLSATISHALSLTPSSPQPQFQFRSHPGAANNNPSQLNFTPHKPSSRDVISGIAPHVFDERRRRRSTSKGRRNSGGRWYDAGYGGGGGGPGCRGRARGSPLRRSVVISWDERSIFLEEATQAGTVTSRISIDIATGHERRDLSDSSCSSGSSGESSCSPTSSASSIASITKEKGIGSKKKTLFGGGGSTAGPRWRGKFKLFRNIVSRMKSRDTPAQAVAAH